MTKRRWSRILLGRSVTGGLVEDHTSCWNGACEIGVIAGTRNIGLGRLFGARSLPCDGTVSVEETRLENANDSIELPLTHATLMFSRRVARAVTEFCRDGRFASRS